MANQYPTPSWIPMDILRGLTNKLEIAGMFNTTWAKEFKREFPVNTTVTLKFPTEFTARIGTLTYAAQDIVRKTTTVTIDKIFGIDFEWDDFDALWRVERGNRQFKENYVDRAVAKLFQQVESECALFAYQNTPNTFGVLGTNPTTRAPFSAAEARIYDLSGGMVGQSLFVSSGMLDSFITGQPVLFNPGKELSDQYKTGLIGEAHGWRWHRSNSLYRHTAGTWAGAVTVNGAGQSGSTLNVTCTNGDTFKKGDHISIANVNLINVLTGRVPSGNQVRHFVITSDVTASGTTAALPIYPEIVITGAYKNVDVGPANSAALTLLPGTSSPNGKSGTVGLALTKEAFAIVPGTFEMPDTKERGSNMFKDSDTGFTLRFVRYWDGNSSTMRNRFDFCMGFGRLRADEGAARVFGA